MMPTYVTPQGPNPVLSVSSPGQHHTCQYPPPSLANPSKRPVGDVDDDDIQFISEKPVKRRRASERQPAVHMRQQPTDLPSAAFVPNSHTAQMQITEGDLRDTERRLSTGMVSFPSDLHAMELTYALRGVSMPVLEKFVFNQPSRKPRPLSPPELSPKQLPSSITPVKSNDQSDQRLSKVPGLQGPSNSTTVCSSMSRPPHPVEKPEMTPNMAKAAPVSSQTHTPEPLANSQSYPTLCPSDHVKTACSKSTPMPPPPPPPPNLQCSEASQYGPSFESSPKSSRSHHHNSSAHSSKQPCQVCSRFRYQAQFSRAQGLPMTNVTLPPHFVAQLPCHQPYGQQIHPQMIAMPTSNMHQFGPNFAPLMMPLGHAPFATPPIQPSRQTSAQQAVLDQTKKLEKVVQRTPEPPAKSQPSQTSQLVPTTSDPKVASSPQKPPTSLIQPTYRKPSPNLIVDVAETCQEKFPFEEVAKRHNVPVEKVLDVFSAIIQVPLLRCPTDRRRPGRLATARIKEYNKTKKAIQDASKSDGSKVDKKQGLMERSMEIAKKLGQVELPEGFSLGNERS